jgi:hypothetical protein
MQSAYRIAGIELHKSMLAVVIASECQGELSFEPKQFGATPSELRRMRQWLMESGVQAAVMESTAQDWKPVWAELEPHCRLHLAQTQSNRAPRGRGAQTNQSSNCGVTSAWLQRTTHSRTLGGLGND